MLDAALFRVCSERLFTKGGVGRSAAHGRPARQSLCNSLWSGLKNHTWVFNQEPDSHRMSQRKVIELKAELALFTWSAIFI